MAERVGSARTGEKVDFAVAAGGAVGAGVSAAGVSFGFGATVGFGEGVGVSVGGVAVSSAGDGEERNGVEAASCALHGSDTSTANANAPCRSRFFKPRLPER